MEPDRLAEWQALWRDSIGLRRADGRPVVASVAGRPALPPEVAWPRDESGSPKDYLMTLDLSALPRIGIDLPDSGVLLFFLDTEFAEPEVMYFEDTAGLQDRQCPEDLGFVPPGRIDLAAVVEPTRPAEDHPYLSGRPAGYYRGLAKMLATEIDHPEPPTCGDHRIGGHYAFSAQYDFPCAPTSEIPDLPGTPGPEALDLPILLVRMDFDPDAGMVWGDCGTSEWSISRDDLAARRFDRVEFSWSCH
ncbi:YwqG family protein [Glycomyces luteolus]|uniref:YwqG family protein n=1 Tax=Glycomyces luteolus TaxID=2670330 RepID=A0A9X3PF95_9ACTN|nr:YwqG family protein [Glycomyces luteolus]MDA1362642.1 YwqG family protein [Glycomyces luteolus]